MDDRARRPSWIAVAALTVSVGALALTALLSVVSAAANSGALVQRVTNLETLAQKSDEREERIETTVNQLKLNDELRAREERLHRHPGP